MSDRSTLEGAKTAEHNRLEDKAAGWKRWGPYLSERQWGTVREDYSTDGNAWDYFTHESSLVRSIQPQTGWTGVIANLIEIFGKVDGPTLLRGGAEAAFKRD